MLDGLECITRMVENNLERPDYLLGLIAHWPGLAILVQMNGDVIAVSRKWASEMGITKSEFFRHGWEHFVHPDDKEGTSTAIAHLMNGPAEFENRWVHGSQTVHLKWTATEALGNRDVIFARAEMA